jgi:hypothetical protein
MPHNVKLVDVHSLHVDTISQWQKYPVQQIRGEKHHPTANSASLKLNSRSQACVARPQRCNRRNRENAPRWGTFGGRHPLPLCAFEGIGDRSERNCPFGRFLCCDAGDHNDSRARVVHNCERISRLAEIDLKMNSSVTGTIGRSSSPYCGPAHPEFHVALFRETSGR